MSEEKGGLDGGQGGEGRNNRGLPVVRLLLMQTRLKGYLDSVTMNIDESGIRAANDRYWRSAA